ncbi:hypothetical protein I4U23_005703 [Adineta vaga]|nr:hypothetical protein I4U23_005703 [Adineta vaga]
MRKTANKVAANPPRQAPPPRPKAPVPPAPLVSPPEVSRRQPVEQTVQPGNQIVSPVPGHQPAPVAASTPESVLSDRANSVLGPPNDSVVSFGDFLPVDINDINIHDLLLNED